MHDMASRHLWEWLLSILLSLVHFYFESLKISEFFQRKMPLSLYRRLDLNKLTPTEISLEMADKPTAIPVGICEDVPVVVTTSSPQYQF